MPGAYVKIQIQGSGQARERTGRFGERLDSRSRIIMEDAASYTQKIAQGLAPKDLGRGAASIHTEPADMAYAIKAIWVVSPLKYMYVQEYGRTAGRRGPPPNALRGWASRHGFRTDRGTLFVLSRSIGRKGYRGKYFMKEASQKAEIYIRRRVARDGAAFIQRAWEAS